MRCVSIHTPFRFGRIFPLLIRSVAEGENGRTDSRARSASATSSDERRNQSVGASAGRWPQLRRAGQGAAGVSPGGPQSSLCSHRRRRRKMGQIVRTVPTGEIEGNESDGGGGGGVQPPLARHDVLIFDWALFSWSPNGSFGVERRAGADSISGNSSPESHWRRPRPCRAHKGDAKVGRTLQSLCDSPDSARANALGTDYAGCRRLCLEIYTGPSSGSQSTFKSVLETGNIHEGAPKVKAAPLSPRLAARKSKPAPNYKCRCRCTMLRLTVIKPVVGRN